MKTLYLSEEEIYPVYLPVSQRDATLVIEMPEDFVLRYELLLEEFWKAQRYITAVAEGSTPCVS